MSGWCTALQDLDRDYDYLKMFAEAAGKGVKRAIMAGSKHPLVMVQGTMPGKGVKECELAGLLGALAAVYVPLEMREVGEKEASKVEGLGWAGGKEVMEEALAIEKGRVLD